MANLPDLLEDCISLLRRAESPRKAIKEAGPWADELSSLLVTADAIARVEFPSIPAHRVADGRARIEQLAEARNDARVRKLAVQRATDALARRQIGPTGLRAFVLAVHTMLGLPGRGRKANAARLSLLLGLSLMVTGGYAGSQVLDRADVHRAWVSVELVVNPPTPTVTPTPVGAGAIVGQVFTLPSPTPVATPTPEVTPTPTLLDLVRRGSLANDPIPIAHSSRAARGITIMPDGGDGYAWRSSPESTPVQEQKPASQ